MDTTVSHTVVKAGPRDVIALIWYGLGYRPRESLVLVGLHGPKRRSGALARIDLPGPGVPRAAREAMVERIVAALRSAGATAAIAVVDGEAVLRHPRPAVARTVRRVASAHGLELLDVIGVGPDAFRSLECDDVLCCPAEGRPLSEVHGSEMAAAQVAAGVVVADGEEDLVGDVRPAGEAFGAPAATSPAPLTTPERLAWFRRWREALAAGAMPSHEAAALARAMHDGLLRDAVLFCALGHPPVEELLTLGSEGPGPGGVAGGPAVPRSVEDLLHRPPRESPDSRGEARRLLAQAARHARPGDRADVLAVLAWEAWHAGNGTRARLLAERALADRPGHRLSLLVTGMLDVMASPPWYRRDRAPGRVTSATNAPGS